jgi:AmmeMemoRadiSam system protein B
VYSGRIAGRAFSQVEVPECAVVLCPNHTGRGSRRSLWPRGSWQIPGAHIEVDEALVALVQRHARLDLDRAAHLGEHAVEVQLPFLHGRRADVKIVAICLGPLAVDECARVGAGLAHAIEEHGKPTLIVASTDMSHYVSSATAERLDRLAIERMLALDPAGLYRVVTDHDISMCGYIPTTVALFASRELAAQRADLVEYGNSGTVSGDTERVVGYAGLVIA